LMSENRKVYTLAKVVIRKSCSHKNQAQVQKPIADSHTNSTEDKNRESNSMT
ncbi:1342_t:CDS:1, partial [Funneliformis geosporum]